MDKIRLLAFLFIPIMIFLSSIFLLPNFWALIPLFITSVILIVLFENTRGDRDYYKEILEIERKHTSLFIDNLIFDNDEYKNKISKLNKEKDFLVSIIKQYNIKDIN